MGTEADQFIRKLATKHRVMALGGLAVIAHGFSRRTWDADIWLEPMESAESWAAALVRHCDEHGGLTLHRLPGWVKVAGEEVTQAVRETRLIRILGLDCPLDVFRQPNEVELTRFDEFADRGRTREDGTILPAPLDLLETKLNTGREKDQQDLFYLEDLTRRDYSIRLPKSTLAEAEELLDRFSDWKVLRSALSNPRPEVQTLARTQLQEFAEAGDPFSKAILEGRKIPYDP